MMRVPPCAKRTATCFPYATLFRSVREAAAQSGDSVRLDIENARQVAPPTRPAPARSATPYLSDAIAKMSVRPAHVNNADAGDRVTADGGMRGNPYPGQAPEIGRAHV